MQVGQSALQAHFLVMDWLMDRVKTIEEAAFALDVSSLCESSHASGPERKDRCKDKSAKSDSHRQEQPGPVGLGTQ